MSCVLRTYSWVLCAVLINLLFWPSQAQQNGITINTGSKYYYIETAEELNFFKAAYACATLGMKLATLESESDLRRIKTTLILNDISTNTYWLSGTTYGLGDTPSKFIDFLTGKKFSTNLAAAKNKCISTKSSTLDQSVDEDCTSGEMHFICEQTVLPNCGKYGQCRYRYY